MTKKILVALMGVMLVVPATGLAQSASDIQSKISALMQQIQALQQQVNQQQGSGNSSQAQSSQTKPVNYGQVVSACRELRNTLRAGQKGEDVVYLQGLLQKEGFSIDQDELSNKEYGESTASAVTGFQEKYKSEILSPAGLKYGSGLAGAATRKKLNALYNCTKPIVTEPPVIMPPAYDKPMVKVKADPYYVVSDGKPGVSTISWKSQNASGCYYEKLKVGTEGSMQITVNQSMIVSISCFNQNSHETANDSVVITLGSGQPTTQPGPVISGVSGPTSLKVEEPGYWKINANASYNDYLSYSVAWGDESNSTGSGMNALSRVSQSATMEHTYYSAGTYNPIFYVTNQNGQVAKTSISVQVGEAVTTVSESVKCVFEGDSTNQQSCYVASGGSDNTYSGYKAQGCSGAGSCITDLKGNKGDVLTWKSSCGGYAYTTMDGQNEYAKFSCGTTAVQPGTLTIEPATVSLGVSQSLPVKAIYTPSSCSSSGGCTNVYYSPKEVSASWTIDNTGVAGLLQAMPDCPTDSRMMCSAVPQTSVTGIAPGAATLRARYTDSSGNVVTATAGVAVAGGQPTAVPGGQPSVENSIKVNYPVGGEVWVIGTKQTIRFSAPSTVSRVNVYLECNTGSGGSSTCSLPTGASMLIASTINTGSVDWSVGSGYSNFTPSSYVIRVSDASGVAGSGVSNAFNAVGLPSATQTQASSQMASTLETMRTMLEQMLLKLMH